MLKIALISISMLVAMWLIAMIYIVYYFEEPEDPYGN